MELPLKIGPLPAQNTPISYTPQPKNQNTALKFLSLPMSACKAYEYPDRLYYAFT